MKDAIPASLNALVLARTVCGTSSSDDTWMRFPRLRSRGCLETLFLANESSSGSTKVLWSTVHHSDVARWMQVTMLTSK